MLHQCTPLKGPAHVDAQAACPLPTCSNIKIKCGQPRALQQLHCTGSGAGSAILLWMVVIPALAGGGGLTASTPSIRCSIEAIRRCMCSNSGHCSITGVVARVTAFRNACSVQHACHSCTNADLNMRCTSAAKHAAQHQCKGLSPKADE